MKQNDLSKCHKQFSRATYHAIRECSHETGITDVETVDRYLKKSASILFRRISILLATKYRRIFIQKCLKHCTVSVREAVMQAEQNARQMEFEFFQMEQFRGVPKRISYLDGKEMKYVEYNRSFEWQRLASIAHLNSGIAADIARRDAEDVSNRFLQPLVKKYGDLEAGKVISEWLRDQEMGAAGGAQ
jgi:hypothetical protein